jgi:hypothetical protein
MTVRTYTSFAQLSTVFPPVIYHRQASAGERPPQSRLGPRLMAPKDASTQAVFRGHGPKSRLGAALQPHAALWPRCSICQRGLKIPRTCSKSPAGEPNEEVRVRDDVRATYAHDPLFVASAEERPANRDGPGRDRTCDLGIKSGCHALAVARARWLKRLVEPNQFGCSWVLWRGIVDLLLTHAVAVPANALGTGPGYAAQIHLHAARAYSWISPPSRSRRWIRVGWWDPTRCRRRLGIGGVNLSARCGLCVL